MDFKKLEKANRIYQEIKILDAQIIEIDKHAMLIANGDVGLDVRLSITDMSKKAEEDKKELLDEDGSLANTTGLFSFIHHSPFGNHIKKEEPKSYQHEYCSDIHESEALQILGVLLYSKQSKRQKLLKMIEHIGVSV